MATLQLQAALPAGTQIPVDVIVQPADTNRRWWIGGVALAVVVALSLVVYLTVRQTDNGAINAAVASATAKRIADEAAIKTGIDAGIAKSKADDAAAKIAAAAEQARLDTARQAVTDAAKKEADDFQKARAEAIAKAVAEAKTKQRDEAEALAKVADEHKQRLAEAAARQPQAVVSAAPDTTQYLARVPGARALEKIVGNNRACDGKVRGVPYTCSSSRTGMCICP